MKSDAATTSNRFSTFLLTAFSLAVLLTSGCAGEGTAASTPAASITATTTLTPSSEQPTTTATARPAAQATLTPASSATVLPGEMAGTHSLTLAAYEPAGLSDPTRPGTEVVFDTESGHLSASGDAFLGWRPGTHEAMVRIDGRLALYDAAGEAWTSVDGAELGPADQPPSGRWAPDGKRFALTVSAGASPARSRILDLEAATVTDDFAGFVTGWSPDGAWLTVSLSDGQLGVLPAHRTSQEAWRIGDARLIEVLGWVAPATFIAVYDDDASFQPDELRLVKVLAGSLTVTATWRINGTVRLSPDGSLVADQGTDRLYLLDAATLAERGSTPVHADNPEKPGYTTQYLKWSPDSQRIALLDQTTVPVYSRSLDREVALPTSGLAGWTLDGRYLVAGQADCEGFDDYLAVDFREGGVVPHAPEWFLGGWSPDFRWSLDASYDEAGSHLRLFRADDPAARPVAILDGPFFLTTWANWSDDSRFVSMATWLPAPDKDYEYPACGVAAEWKDASPLHRGDGAVVNTRSDDRMIVRVRPGMSAPELTRVANGTRFQVVEGPVAIDDRVWVGFAGGGWAAVENLEWRAPALQPATTTPGYGLTDSVVEALLSPDPDAQVESFEATTVSCLDGGVANYRALPVCLPGEPPGHLVRVADALGCEQGWYPARRARSMAG